MTHRLIGNCPSKESRDLARLVSYCNVSKKIVTFCNMQPLQKYMSKVRIEYEFDFMATSIVLV